MKCLLFLFFFAFSLLPCLRAAEDELDLELTKFSKSLAAQIEKASIKKIAVIDFTDLQGHTLELGKFIAEQTTVNLVEIGKSFAVVYRSHMNKILAEHRLSAEGLTEPENAKKFGQFSGVDAIVIGTVTPFRDTYRITAKVISTVTTDIVGATKGQIPKTQETSHLAVIKAEKPTLSAPQSASEVKPIEVGSKTVGDIFLKAEKLRLVDKDGYGYLQLTLITKNLSTSSTLSVGLYSRSNVEVPSMIVNDRGDEFKLYTSGVFGLPIGYSEAYLADIAPHLRKPFMLYVDEFQNVATTSFASILSEARKYKLCLTVAHQYVGQLNEDISKAIFGNVGSVICFRVGEADGTALENQLGAGCSKEHLTTLNDYEVFARPLNEPAFRARSLPPLGQKVGKGRLVRQRSRQKYGTYRDVIDNKIDRWIKRRFF